MTLPILAETFSWTPAAMGTISSAFAIAYAPLAQMPVGALIDRIGPRLTYIWSLMAWSLASMVTTTVNGFASIYVFRLILGIGEAPAFPATKTAAEWTSRRERGMAAGIFTAGVKVGSAIALPLVTWLVYSFG